MLQNPLEPDIFEGLDALIGHRRGLAIAAETVELTLMVAPLPELGVRIILALASSDAGRAGLSPVLLELLVALIPLLGLRLAERAGGGTNADDTVGLLWATTAGGEAAMMDWWPAAAAAAMAWP